MTIDQTTGEIVGLENGTFTEEDQHKMVVQTPRETVFIRTAYNYNMDAVSDETGLYCPEPTKTQQHFAEEVDINTIVRRFGLTGEMPQNLNERMPLTGDFTEHVTDYQTALNLVRAADEAFMELPAEIRAEFDNDPQKFIKFAENPENKDRARKLGMLKPEEPAQAPIAVRVIPEEGAAPPAPPK